MKHPGAQAENSCSAHVHVLIGKDCVSAGDFNLDSSLWFFVFFQAALLPNVLPEYRLYNAVFILLNLSQRSFFNSEGVGCAVLVVGGRPSAPSDP